MELKSPTIERLPNELIVGVLNELDFRDLLKCRGVSQSFKNLIDHSPHLKYKIELAVAGMIDAGGNNISIKERRTRLMKYQSNWTDLQWQQVENLPLSGGNVWELFGNVMAVKTRSGGLSFKRLAGHSRSVAAKSWDLENLGVEFMTFALDPSQDLLVLVETTRQGLGGLPTISGTQPFRIHLRSMSTGEDHPSSLDSIYHLAQLYVINGDWRFGVQFLGDNLGISFESANSSTTEICVWNWKTGHLLKVVRHCRTSNGCLT
ncbi:hypothetical protein JAAARDRAFT_59537 [Jaapia argillacea MUCL 33604]|uniref:F-box domain-containing protein n=1 Tax=Jaapia argillacea MUCL 33604 TaxID=933084 RepID=A0A067Q0J3_9AGAM|nr:hypothetical protein JAAARDRAFT_59537 [Jaapia argillacea MUCL 33604]